MHPDKCNQYFILVQLHGFDGAKFLILRFCCSKTEETWYDTRNKHIVDSAANNQDYRS